MKQTPAAPSTPLLEALSIVALCFGWFILGSLWSVGAGFRNGPITDASLLGIVGFELVMGPLALFVLYSRGYDMGSLRPVPSWKGCAVGALLYVGGILASIVALAPFGDDPSQPIERLMAAAHPSLASVLLLSVVNGLYEEMFLLGYLMKGLRRHGNSFALGASLLVRVLYHLYQGPYGALSIAAIGLVFGVFYLRTGWLWPVVFAHMLADTVPFL